MPPHPRRRQDDAQPAGAASVLDTDNPTARSANSVSSDPVITVVGSAIVRGMVNSSGPITPGIQPDLHHDQFDQARAFIS